MSKIRFVRFGSKNAHYVTKVERNSNSFWLLIFSDLFGCRVSGFGFQISGSGFSVIALAIGFFKWSKESPQILLRGPRRRCQQIRQVLFSNVFSLLFSNMPTKPMEFLHFYTFHMFLICVLYRKPSRTNAISTIPLIPDISIAENTIKHNEI